MSNVIESEWTGTAGQFETIIPRDRLPDDWSGKGACPVCSALGQLHVRHQDEAPDQMVCSRCGTVFQVETAGTRIRLAAAPPALAKTAGFLYTWLTPGELETRIETALLVQPTGPFEPLTPTAQAALVNAAEPAPAETLVAKTVEPANGAAEPEPGTEDWFASLAAAIGGLTPEAPPPDDVLADELERVLTTRAAAVPDGAAGPAADADVPAVALAGKDAAPALAPAGTVEPGTPVKTAPLRLAKPESAWPDAAVLAGLDEMPGQGAVPTPPEVNLTPAAAVIVPPVASEAALAGPQRPGELAAAPTLVTAAAVAAGSDPQPGIVLAAPSLAPAPTGPSASRHELAERAWKLHELGNSVASIQSALEASRGAPEDVAAIMSKLAALEQARRDRFRRNLQITIGGGLAVILALLVIAVLITLIPAPAATPGPAVTLAGSAAPGSVGAPAGTPAPGATGAPGAPAGTPTAALSYNPLIALLNQVLPGDVKIANGPSPTPAPTSELLSGLFPATPTLSQADRATEDAKKSGLPSWVSTLVPSGITVINVPTPSVDNNGPAGSPCPSTADQASALFGGPAASWSFSRQQGGWIFILAANPTSIRIPANMSAGYLSIGDTLEMRSVLGPATIHNVNFAAVSCAQ